MKDNILDIINDFKQIVLDDTPNLPCNKCDGDCCGSTAPFTMSEINTIKKKYSKLFKKYTYRQSNDSVDMYIIKKKGKPFNIDDKCVFYNNGCSIYDIRPTICKDYGVKKYIQCPYNGLDSIPVIKEERTRLTLISQEAQYSFIDNYISKNFKK